MVTRLLTLLISLFAFSLTLYSQESAPVDSARVEQPDTISLSTVQIEAQAYRQKGDHVDIYMKKENENFGTNALDAISSLPFFKESRDAQNLTTIGQENVTILINGVPADGMSLRGYQGNEIKKVEFYEYAPLKYMYLTKGPLVNIITKKKIDRLYSAYLNGWNSLDRPGGEYQAVLTYADSLHQVKVNGYTNYGNNKRSNSTIYSYPDGITNSYVSKHARNKYTSFSINPSYQFYDNKNLFNASLYVRTDNQKDNIPSTYSFTENETLYEGTSGKHLRASDTMASLSLFYSRSFSQTRSLTVIMSGGYSDALSRNHIWRESAQSEQVAYDIFNRIKNKAYSLNGSISYSAGASYVGAYYAFSKIDQNSDGAMYYPTTQSASLYGGYSINRENMGFYPAVGGILDHTSSMGIRHTVFTPYIRLLYRAWVSQGTFNGLSASLSLPFTSTGVAGGGQITDAETFLDNRFIAVGNPNLKSSWCITPKLRIAYNKPDGKVNIDLTYSPIYYNRYNASVIFENNDKFYMTTANLGHLWSHTVSLGIQWRVFDWLNLMPYFEYYKKSYSTPSRDVDFSYARAGTVVSFTIKKFYIAMTASSPTKDVNGDLIQHGSGQYSIGADWDHKNLSLGLRYHIYDHKDYTRGRADGFRYINTPRYRNFVMLSATYRITHGKARRHPNAGGAYSVDNGLTSVQQPKN